MRAVVKAKGDPRKYKNVYLFFYIGSELYCICKIVVLVLICMIHRAAQLCENIIIMIILFNFKIRFIIM